PRKFSRPFQHANTVAGSLLANVCGVRRYDKHVTNCGFDRRFNSVAEQRFVRQQREDLHRDAPRTVARGDDSDETPPHEPSPPEGQRCDLGISSCKSSPSVITSLNWNSKSTTGINDSRCRADDW